MILVCARRRRKFGNGCSAIWQVFVFLTEHDAEEDGEQGGGQVASLLDAFGDL